MPGATRPMPLTLMKTPSPLPRSTTFVSPVTIGTPASSAAACIEATMRERSLSGRPSSRMRPAESASGCAPHIARSFTVPCTASEPMSPPGKKSGLMTNESVENARRAPPASKTAPSCSSRSAGLSKLLRKTFSIRRCVIRPPPPCARRIVSPSPAGTGQLAASSAAPGSDAGSFALTPDSRRPARRGSRPRRRPRTTPWAHREDAPACSACRTPCIRSVFSGPAGSRPRCTPSARRR